MLRLLLVVLLIGIFALGVHAARAAPLAVVDTTDGAVLTLTDEPCSLPAVRNLPRRATWVKGRERFEGCYGIQDDGSLLSYWDDRTVAVITLIRGRAL